MALNEYYDLQVITLSNLDEIIDYERKKLRETFITEIDLEIQEWGSKWRKESLEHYLPLGWSFLAKEENQIVGYFIAQPMLFVDGQTQSLWVEHLQYTNLKARDELCELAYKLAREKHFQKVYFPQSPGVYNSIKSLKAEPWGTQTLVIKTSKAL